MKKSFNFVTFAHKKLSVLSEKRFGRRSRKETIHGIRLCTWPTALTQFDRWASTKTSLLSRFTGNGLTYERPCNVVLIVHHFIPLVISLWVMVNCTNAEIGINYVTLQPPILLATKTLTILFCWNSISGSATMVATDSSSLELRRIAAILAMSKYWFNLVCSTWVNYSVVRIFARFADMSACVLSLY